MKRLVLCTISCVFTFAIGTIAIEAQEPQVTPKQLEQQLMQCQYELGRVLQDKAVLWQRATKAESAIEELQKGAKVHDEKNKKP